MNSRCTSTVSRTGPSAGTNLAWSACSKAGTLTGPRSCPTRSGASSVISTVAMQRAAWQSQGTAGSGDADLGGQLNGRAHHFCPPGMSNVCWHRRRIDPVTEISLSQADSSPTIVCVGFAPVGCGSVLRWHIGKFTIGANRRAFGWRLKPRRDTGLKCPFIDLLHFPQ
jgi:hypothetical protein